MVQTIEKILEKELNGIGVPLREESFILSYLDLVREYDLSTYYHSIRVCLLSLKIARHLDLDEKTLLLAGLTHDVGKVLIKKDILQKKDALTEKEMEQIKNHPVYSYELLKDKYRLCAEVVLRHHRYQPNSYPNDDQSITELASDVRSKIDDYARILSIADAYDALTTRVNHRLNKKKLSGEEVKSILLKDKPDASGVIADLYANRILR